MLIAGGGIRCMGDMAGVLALTRRRLRVPPPRIVLLAREMGCTFRAKRIKRLVRDDLCRGSTRERFHTAVEWLYGWRVENCLTK